MGRYDKIKVYNSGSFVQPNRIRVYNNGWQDLGTDDSANTQTLAVRHNGEFKRATLNKKTTTTVTDRWATGPFKVWPISGYCSRPDIGYPFEIHISNMRHTDAVDSDIFYAHNSDWSSYITIVWLADGRIRFRTCYNGIYRETYSNNAVGVNQSASLSCATYNDNGVARQALSFNGNWSGGGGTSMMSQGNFENTVCGANIQMRGNITIKGCTYSGGNHYANTRTFDTSYASGSDGYNYQDVVHHESSSTSVTWE